ncbi:MAG: flavin reductase [Muribaculaceae bacterium]|nr:flavin reductase [Muribaculaceae bacterium]
MKKNFSPKAWLLPQPVLIIGTYDAEGTPNAMNAAWGGQWDMKQIMISLGAHATTENINRDGVFTVAFATEETLVGADYVGLVSGKKQHDKVAHAGWSSERGEHVNAPVFDCFPMTFECKVAEKLYESETGCYLIADIVNIVADEKYLASDGKPDVEKMNLITFDPIHNGYIALGKRVGDAFSAGKALK